MKKLFLMMIAALAICSSCEEKQDGGDERTAATLTVTPASIPAVATAGTYTLTVTSNTSWTATVEEAATHDWCRIINGAQGSENGAITLQTVQNTVVEERYATITVAAGTLTRQVTVTQAAAAPVLEVDKTAIPAAIAAATYSIGVTSNLTWAATVNSGATWCTLANANASGNGTVTVQVAENPTIETRSATVTVTSGTLTRTVAVTQADAAPALAVDKITIDATVNAASYDVSVTSNSTWTAAVNSSATWCTLANASASGNGTVTVNVAANPTIETRAATVTVTSGTLTRTVAVTQSGAAPALAVDKTTIPAVASAATYSIGVTSNLTWAAAVNSAATWCTLTNANASGNGTVTVNVAANAATVTRAATVTISAGTLTRTVAVTQSILTPPYAATEQTWVFGVAIWSDAIHIPSCDKTSWDRYNKTAPQCRSLTSENNTWYYYNWYYMVENSNLLCPTPWSLPSRRSIQNLAYSADPDYIVSQWGLGGNITDGYWYFEDTGEYWSTTQNDESTAYALMMRDANNDHPAEVYDGRQLTRSGLQVRCVINGW